jgi:hypothetical protein
MNTTQSILFLILGWLFGLLSPAIVDEIRRRRQVSQIKASVLVELTEVRLKLAADAFSIFVHFGTWDRPMLEWFKSIFDLYSGSYADPKFIKATNEMLSCPDSDLSVIINHFKSPPHKALSIRSYFTPVMDSQVANFVIFNVDTQNLLTEIRTQLTFMNEIVEQAQFFYQKTFDSGVSEKNGEIIKNNLNEAYQKLGEKALSVADLISSCMKSW